MCGIFGVLTTKESPLTRSGLPSIVAPLFRVSESRGKEAAGIRLLTDETIRRIPKLYPGSPRETSHRPPSTANPVVS